MTARRKLVANSPPELVEHIRAIQKLTRRSVNDVVEIGNRLRHCRTLVSPGQWTAWLAANVGFNFRTARVFVQVAKFAEGKEYAKIRLFNLPPHAIARLSGCDTATIDAVVDAAQANGKLQGQQVLAIIRSQSRRSEARAAEYQAQNAELRALGDAAFEQLRRTGRCTLAGGDFRRVYIILQTPTGGWSAEPRSSLSIGAASPVLNGSPSSLAAE
jgi:Protein of unknown function (DUF3102)